MRNRLKDIILYAGLDREQFKKIEPLMAAENHTTLKFAAIVQALYAGFSFFSSFGLEEMANKKLVYGFGTLVPLIILVLHLLYSKKNLRLQQILIYLYSFSILSMGLLCTLVCTPDEMTILLLIFYFCVAMLFVGSPLYLIIIVLVSDTLYFVFAPILKDPAVLSIDCIDVAIFSTLGMLLGVYLMRGRCRRYWLELTANELAEYRYRAAYVDYLTGALNRAAFEQDLHQMEKDGPDKDFVYIALDLNGLKMANDTLGHSAGDELIIAATDCMQQSFGAYGKVYRTGGDEFVVIMVADETQQAKCIDDFNARTAAWSGSLSKRLTISYGIVAGEEVQRMTMHEISFTADKRMYAAKSEYYHQRGIDRRGRLINSEAVPWTEPGKDTPESVTEAP